MAWSNGLTMRAADDGDATSGHADSGWDDYAERVLRNEGRLIGLESLVSETRVADRRLIEQRSDSLAQELERRATALLELVTARADAVLALGHEERESDRREYRLLFEERDRQHTTATQKNFEQSSAAITGLEQRRIAATDALEQIVRQWRESDKEARELFAKELGRHLDILNHANERISAFQAASVTRELWQAEKDSTTTREGLLRDQIISLEKAALLLMPVAVAEKAHAEILSRSDLAIAAATAVLDTKIQTLAEKVDDLKLSRASTTGRSSGYSAVYAWIATGLTVLVSVVVLANAFFSK